MLGSHNSLTYMPPKKWYMNLFKIFYKCQNITLEEQLKLGIRCFDIRVKLDKNWNWRFAHGLVIFDCNYIYSVFDTLNKYKCSVRLILEDKPGKSYHELEFIKLCRKLENQYKCISFFEGRRKKDWKKLYTFNYENIYQTTDQFVGSMQSKFIGKISPKLWDLFNHTKSRKLAKESKADVILLDFLNNEDNEIIKILG